ncbi:MAG: hypothetical protein R3D27_00455 [Hyphomicrobiaceae bacterium]
MSDIYIMRGRCRCRAISATLVMSRPPGVLRPRACQCAFCIEHNALTFSDPAGHLTIEAMSPDFVAYQSWDGGARTLHCARCGTYVAVLLSHGGQLTGALNIRGIAVDQLRALPALAVDDQLETVEAKQARRSTSYMPVELVNFDPPAVAGQSAGHPTGPA